MIEEKTSEEKEVEKVVVGDGVKPDENVEAVQKEALNMVDSANVAADRMEKANSRMEVNLARQEKMQAKAILGGFGNAGQAAISDDEKADANARKMLEGTGYDESLFPAKKS